MTRWPTTFDSQVWATPRAPVAIDSPIMPATRNVSSCVSCSGNAVSRTALSRNGDTMLSAAENVISARTVVRRARYGRNRAAIRRLSDTDVWYIQ